MMVPRLYLKPFLLFIYTAKHIIALRSPKINAMFSERYGHGVRVLPLGAGWRITIRRRA